VYLRFEEATEDDIPELTRVMTRAFDDDARRHLGVEKGGPEGYDNGDFFRKWLLPYDESVGYKITSRGQVVGGFIVWTFEHGRNRLGTIFVDPDVQDRGLGTRAWEFIERTYADAESWTLATPGWATKNHHFYEAKCGFARIRAEDSPQGVFFVYHKVVS
jgi:GNAT superfamily N-acetyltransferase